MISFVVACYNEEDRIARDTGPIVRFLEARGEPWELILVDDGSRDRTLELLRAKEDGRIRVLGTKRNHGQGAALKIGVLATKGDVVVYSDADLPVTLETIEGMIAKLREGADVVVASRWMAGARIGERQPELRHRLGRIFYWLVRASLLPGIHDTNCGLKVYRGSVARILYGFVRSWRWAFNVEHLWFARRCGYVLVEHPVEWSHRGGSKVRVFHDCLWTLWELGWIKFREACGLYPEVVLAAKDTAAPAERSEKAPA